MTVRSCHQSHEMNSLINQKSAEKRLQFGISKCKTILVGKSVKNFHKNPLFVDSWNTSYTPTGQGGDSLLTESYGGEVTMERSNQYKYMGHCISNSNNNMVNINAIKIKSIYIKKKIYSTLESLKLGKYYFECGILLMNSLLRRSILYSAETYYNSNEKEIREFEKIEEDYLRNLINTERGCPISQLYLEFGQYPA